MCELTVKDVCPGGPPLPRRRRRSAGTGSLQMKPALIKEIKKRYSSRPEIITAQKLAEGVLAVFKASQPGLVQDSISTFLLLALSQHGLNDVYVRYIFIVALT